MHADDHMGHVSVTLVNFSLLLCASHHTYFTLITLHIIDSFSVCRIMREICQAIIQRYVVDITVFGVMIGMVVSVSCVLYCIEVPGMCKKRGYKCRVACITHASAVLSLSHPGSMFR